MPFEDEPLFPESGNKHPDYPESDPRIAELIRKMVTQQLYGVLCTQGQGQPYGSMIAFSFSKDLRFAVFATPIATRKYRLLTECDHVALVIDNRPQHPNNMMKVEAVTVTGRAKEVDTGREFDEYSKLLVDRHPQLESFVNASSSALFRVDVFRFFHVSRFQEVIQWVPPSR
jgi:nitroimidazol reductase NimA-like FMN-containing flavoprotein (pyridoxamine 5'-phosphate oxidase superfamily)